MAPQFINGHALDAEPGRPPRMTAGVGGDLRGAGSLVSFADIVGEMPAGVWGVTLDEDGNPFTMYTGNDGYNFAAFLVAPDRGGFGAAARTFLEEAQDAVFRFGGAQAAFTRANALLYAANGWSNRAIYESGYTYSPGDGGYHAPEVVQGSHIPELPVVGRKAADDGQDIITGVRFPVGKDLAAAVAAAGYVTYDGRPLALLGTVSRWSRMGHFTRYNVEPTTHLQIDVARLSNPARIGALIAGVVSLAIAVATENVPGVIAAVASLGAVVGQAVAEGEAAIGAALRAEGVSPATARSTVIIPPSTAVRALGPADAGTSPPPAAQQQSNSGWAWFAAAVLGFLIFHGE